MFARMFKYRFVALSRTSDMTVYCKLISFTFYRIEL